MLSWQQSQTDACGTDRRPFPLPAPIPCRRRPAPPAGIFRNGWQQFPLLCRQKKFFLPGAAPLSGSPTSPPGQGGRQSPPAALAAWHATDPAGIASPPAARRTDRDAAGTGHSSPEGPGTPPDAQGQTPPRRSRPDAQGQPRSPRLPAAGVLSPVRPSPGAGRLLRRHHSAAPGMPANEPEKSSRSPPRGTGYENGASGTAYVRPVPPRTAPGPARSPTPGSATSCDLPCCRGTGAPRTPDARTRPVRDQDKNFRGDGGAGAGGPFSKGLPSPAKHAFPAYAPRRAWRRPLPPRHSHAPTPSRSPPLAFAARIGQSCGQQKEMA